ncbi:galactokinase [Purpureocillium lavendulum]|uniref:Galactokinase n=1 Tax=Purpureocillium lavendulum TaxID=1247861 RepID=A0AB34G1J7_9HYPO|nr:galactokinase [Purpureocillium lavendulum]
MLPARRYPNPNRTHPPPSTMSGPVPVAAALADVYPTPALAHEAPRWNHLLATFEAVYGHRADFVSRSPGRVNIIGEHIDYSLYSVLPMAITFDALLAVSATPVPDGATSFTLRVANVEPDKFPAKDFSVPLDGNVDIDAAQFEWTNYFKSGLRGALELLRKKRGPSCRPCNMEVLMDGNVPVGGGLSSSAAFTSAAALAVMVANGEKSVDKTELTELAIVSERAVGVNSGGMDQSASVFSEPGSALFVSFCPRLEARPVQFPPTNPELCFIIAQSFVTSNKQVSGPIHYNLRVVEVTLAAAYLNAVLNPPGTQLPADAGPLGTSLRGFHDTYFYHQNASDYGAVKSLAQEDELQKLIELTRETLTQEEGYTREDIAKVLNLSTPDFEKRFLSSFPVRAECFKLRQRALHVFTEALRVLKFITLLERPVHTGRSDTTPFNEELGALMNATQVSCRDLYDCSCPELDDICSIARNAGAYGSRLTGAGWGGCSVHLVPVDKVADVKAALEREYYSKKELTDEQRENAVVVSRPAGGSAIYRVDDTTVRS